MGSDYTLLLNLRITNDNPNTSLLNAYHYRKLQIIKLYATILTRFEGLIIE